MASVHPPFAWCLSTSRVCNVWYLHYILYTIYCIHSTQTNWKREKVKSTELITACGGTPFLCTSKMFPIELPLRLKSFGRLSSHCVCHNATNMPYTREYPSGEHDSRPCSSYYYLKTEPQSTLYFSLQVYLENRCVRLTFTPGLGSETCGRPSFFFFFFFFVGRKLSTIFDSKKTCERYPLSF